VGDDDLLPKKKTSSTAKPASKKSSSGKSSPKVSSSMRSLMRAARAIGIGLGSFITIMGLMSLFGLVLDNGWIRVALALLVVVGLPLFVSDRVMKRAGYSGGLGMVGDIFAIVLLGVALVFVGADFVTRPMFVREGDRNARSGSRTMARAAYFLAGVSPTFPDEKGAAPAGSGSASASASAGADGGKR
jgi:hypothetical protein